MVQLLKAIGAGIVLAFVLAVTGISNAHAAPADDTARSFGFARLEQALQRSVDKAQGASPSARTSVQADAPAVVETSSPVAADLLVGAWLAVVTGIAIALGVAYIRAQYRRIEYAPARTRR